MLLVSHFGSTLHSMFTAAAPSRLGLMGKKGAFKEELRFTVSELRDHEFDLTDSIGEVLVAKRQISFQGMQSTSRAFDGFLGIQVLEGRPMNNIILAQAAGHVIVHCGAVVDSKCLNQLRDAALRDVKPAVSLGDLLTFDPGDVETVAASMTVFVADISNKLTR